MGIFLAVLAAVFAALTVVLTKAGLEKTDSYISFAVQAVLILVISWGIALAKGNIRSSLTALDSKSWTFLIAAGVCTTLSTVFSYRALQDADTSLIVPIERLSLVFATILAAVFLKEKITWPVILGIGLMTVGAVIIGFAKK